MDLGRDTHPMPPFPQSQTRHGVELCLHRGRPLFWGGDRDRLVFLHRQDLPPPADQTAQEEHQPHHADRHVGDQPGTPQA